MFITKLNFGLLLKKSLSIHKLDITFTLIYGQFLLMLLTYVVAFLFRINVEFFIALLLLNFTLFWLYKTEWKEHISGIKEQFNQFTKFNKILLLGLSIFTLAQSAIAPYLLDNESYYVQSIQWLNEYGFVKGVANLHPFLGQYSGWHVLQSGLNFSFLASIFNDINGFTYIIVLWFGLKRLQEYTITKEPIDLIIGLIPLFTVFFFPFISSPSQDFPIFLFTQLLLFTFIKNFRSYTKTNYYSALILTLFILSIKVIPIVLVTIPILIFFSVIKEHKKVWGPSFILCLITLILFWTKNYIISGYPMFPSAALNYAEADWKIPSEIQKYNYGYAKAYALLTTAEYYDSLSFVQKFTTWLQLSKLRGLFNNLMILLVVLVPFCLLLIKKRKSYLWAYTIGVLHLLFLLNTSAQYRFYFNYFIFFSLLIIASFKPNLKLIKIGLITSITIVIIPLFLPLKLTALSQNRFAMDMPSFQFNEFIVPHKNSKFKGGFQTIKKGNLTFNSAIKEPNVNNEVFYWSTGDGKLP